MKIDFARRLTALIAIAAFLPAAFAADMPGNGRVRFGVDGHALVAGTYTDMPLERQIDLLRSIGFESYRININPGRSDKFERLDQLVGLARSAGIRILPVVVLPPKDYPDEAAAFADARQKMAKLARQFDGRIETWEIGNEYDLYCVEPGASGASPDDYDDAKYQVARGLIKGMLAGLHDGSPAARSIVETSQHTRTSLDSGFLARLIADGVSFDITGYHFYSNDGHLPQGSSGENSLKILSSLFRKPIWITEFDKAAKGSLGPNADPQAQGEALTTAMREISRDGPRYHVIAANIYELLDEPDLLEKPGEKPAQAQFGILGSHGGFTAAASAVRSFLKDRQLDRGP